MATGVVIVGAGSVGLSTALHCAWRGLRVTVIDRGSPDRDGCSFGNAGMITPSHFIPLAAPGMVALGLKWMWNPASPFYVKPRWSPDLLRWGWLFWRAATESRVTRASPLLRDLAFAGSAEYAALASQPGFDFGLARDGLLMLCATPHALDEEAHAAERARSLGLEAKVLDPKGIATLEPDFRADVAGGVLYPQDGSFVPARFMRNLQRAVEAAGVTFVWNTNAIGWHREGSRKLRAVKTTGGEIDGDEFVLCGGSWSPGLARDAGLRLPIEAGKGYQLTLPSPRNMPRRCAILVEARVAVTPMDGSLRFAGTMEIAGLDTRIDPVRVRAIVTAASRYYPEIEAADFDGVVPWSGLRPCSPDGLPYIGRTAKFENLSIATGHAMMGMTLGPVTGRIVADLLCGAAPGFDLAPLSPDRYA